jgi:hypothetical protein
MQYKKQNVQSNLSNKMNADDSRLLGCDITSLCEQFPTFQRNLQPSSSRVSSARGFGLLDCLTLDDVSTMVPQNVGTSHPVTQQHMPKDSNTGTFNETCTDTCFLLHLICMSHITLSYKILIFSSFLLHTVVTVVYLQNVIKLLQISLDTYVSR